MAANGGETRLRLPLNRCAAGCRGNVAELAAIPLPASRMRGPHRTAPIAWGVSPRVRGHGVVPVGRAEPLWPSMRSCMCRPSRLCRGRSCWPQHWGWRCRRLCCC